MLPTICKRVRKVTAEKIWAVAHRLYPYAERTFDPAAKYWTMEATYIGTEEEADKWFERLCCLDCEDAVSPMHECAFAVGGMRSEEIKDDDDDE